jgi:bifunctional DNA-binding transcriptional regulator/antitoxin component of YhaV-PrlF toxin-antitoxin module
MRYCGVTLPSPDYACMRLQEDGTITVPTQVREELGWVPGQNVQMEVTNGALVIRNSPENAAPEEELIQSMKGKGRLRMRTKEIMQLLRGDE